jgi:DNA mismatch repair protein MutS2
VLDAAEAGRAAAGRDLANAIAKLEESRRRHDVERAALSDERRALAELEARHSALVAELTERRRQRWASELEEARSFVRALKAEGRAALETVRRQGPDASRTLADFGRKAADAIASRAVAARTPEPDDAPPVIGDHVEVQGTNIRGELVELQGETARLRSGALTFQAPLANLRRRVPDAAPNAALLRSRRLPPTDEPASELRLVGMRVREALECLERFLDDAQSAGLPSVRIVHGLGTGALKRAVTEYLARTTYASAFHDAEANAGGPGVTVASLL